MRRSTAPVFEFVKLGVAARRGFAQGDGYVPSPCAGGCSCGFAATQPMKIW